MAAPFVAAAAAMLLVNNPSLTPSKVENAIKNIAGDMGVKGSDSSYGAGVLDFGVFFGDKDNATSISIEEKEVTLYFSKVIKFEPTAVTVNVSPTKATNKAYTVKIADSSIVSFNGFGFSAKKVGETTATFTFPNGKSVKIKIKCEKRKFWVDYTAKSFAGGSGTQNDPYLVKTPQQLARIAYMGDHGLLSNNICFKQIADIDLKGKTWYPILGTDKDGLVSRINYDSGGYKIKNLQISNISTNVYIYYSGLFAANMGEMKNINLINVDINSPESNRSAGICASFGGIMRNCYVSGKIVGNAVGGLVGELSAMNGLPVNSVISNCRCDAVLSGTQVGGIAWIIANGEIENCIFTGEINDTSGFGGIVYAANAYNPNTETDLEFNRCKIVNCISVENIANSVSTATEVTVSQISSDNPYVKSKFTVSTGTKIIPVISNCYYSGEYSQGINNIKSGTKVTSVKKVDGSLFKKASFYYENERWNTDSAWAIGKTWKVKNDYPTLIYKESTVSNSLFNYYESDDSIVINGYYGLSPYVVIPSYINGKPVRTIAFGFTSKNVDVITIKLPDTVKIIDSEAFGYDHGRIKNSLRYIDLGNGLKYIGYAAFLECKKLEVINIPKSLKVMEGYAFHLSSINSVFFEGNVNQISKKAFSGNLIGLEKLTIYYNKNASGWDKYKPVNMEYTPKKKAYDPKVPLKAIYTDTSIGEAYVKSGTKTKLNLAIFPASASSAKLTYSRRGTNINVDANGILTTSSKGGYINYILVYYEKKQIGSITAQTIGSKNNYTVKFNSNGATSGTMQAQTLTCKVPSKLSANKFVKDGYVFLG